MSLNYNITSPETLGIYVSVFQKFKCVLQAEKEARKILVPMPTGHVKLLCRWSSFRISHPPIFQRKLKNPKAREAQSVLQHRCTLKIATGVSHDALLALIFLVLIKMQNLWHPFEERLWLLCASLFLLGIPIMAFYGMNKLQGGQFNRNCLKQREDYDFPQQMKVLALSDNNSSCVLLTDWLDDGWWELCSHSGSESLRIIANEFNSK